MSRVRAPSVTPIDQFGGTQVPLHCSGPSFGLGDAPLAQRQSNGLLIRRFWVRNPGGAPHLPGETCPIGAVWSQIGHGDDLGAGQLAHRSRIRRFGSYLVALGEAWGVFASGGAVGIVG